ncbi:MAG TPA: MATE family efflux transporter [Treponemataceae bacterium]|nr:MATE family efflux transporter [Treponemataceae bacterium]
MTKDLTKGSPFKLIIGFSLPLLLGNLFQQLYNVVDMIIVGRFLGVECLAAVGSTGAINFLVVGFCMGVGNGFAIPIAHTFGAKDYKTLRQYVASSVHLSIVFVVIITVLTVAFCRPLLELMQTPLDIIDQAEVYIKVIFAGIPVLFMYNLLASIIRALGDSKTPVVFLLVSSVLNIILDFVFIAILKTGIVGAAYATVISQFVSGILCLLFIRKNFRILDLSKDDWKRRPQHYRILSSMGFPMGLQYSITAIGSVILQSSVNSLGSDIVAAVSAAVKISLFFSAPFDALGSTMATYAGQNTGAGKIERLKKGLWTATLIGFAYALIAFIVLFLFGRTFGTLFMDSSENLILDRMHTYLIVLSSFYMCLVIVNNFRFMIQGMGFSNLAVFAGVFELAGRAIIAIVFVPLFGFIAACFASPIAWVLADFFLIPAFLLSLKKLEKRKVI